MSAHRLCPHPLASGSQVSCMSAHRLCPSNVRNRTQRSRSHGCIACLTAVIATVVIFDVGSFGFSAGCPGPAMAHIGPDLRGTDLGVAMMLLGSVAFTMSLFYMVNSEDPDIKRYTWEFLDSTIVIFAAVLTFQAFDCIIFGVAEIVFGRHESGVYLVANIIQFGFWLVCLHVFIAWFAFYSANVNSNRRHANAAAAHAQQQVAFHQRSRENYDCYARVIAHIAGFAAIKVGTILQHSNILGTSLLTPMLATFVVAFVFFVLLRFSDFVRSLVARRGERAEIAAEIWDENVEEAENDIAALTVSFLIVTACCTSISGVISHEDILDLSGHEQPWYGILKLVACYCGFVAMAYVSLLVLGQHVTEEGEFSHHAHATLERMSRYLSRWVFIALSSFSMGASWCFLIVLKWLVTRRFEIQGFHVHPNSTIKAVIAALLTSKLAFVEVLRLKKMHDREPQTPLRERMIQMIMHTIGIRIGFVWELAFDASVEVIAEPFEEWGQWYLIGIKLFFAICVVAIVIPAWRMYIVRTVERLAAEAKDAEEAKLKTRGVTTAT